MDSEKLFPAVEMALRWIYGGEYSSLWEYNKLQSSWAPLFEGRLALTGGKVLVRGSKAFSRISFSAFFRASNHQSVGKKNLLEFTV